MSSGRRRFDDSLPIDDETLTLPAAGLPVETTIAKFIGQQRGVQEGAPDVYTTLGRCSLLPNTVNPRI
jgi:hypothetical protein